MAIVATSLFEFFKDKIYCDVTFKVRCGNTWSCFPAHKLVLNIWSPILAYKFKSNRDAFDEEIEIVDIRPSIFEAFLNYLYGSEKELKRNENDIKFILDLYEVASRYQVQKLKTHCCEILNSSAPNKDNVFDLIAVALLINSNCLKERCYKVLQSETEDVLKSQDLEAVSPSMVMTLLQLPSLWLRSEFELLTWVLTWARFYFSNQKNINSPREILNPFLPYLNFAALKSKEFAEVVSKHREFFDEVECFKIFMNINIPESIELPIWFDRSKSTHKYTKPIENVLLADFQPELSYSENNLESHQLDTLHCNAISALSDGNASTSPIVATVDVATNTTAVTESNFDDASTTNNCNRTSKLTVEKMTQTEIAIDANNELANPSRANLSVALDPEISVISSFSTVKKNEIQSDESMKIDNNEAASSDSNLSVKLYDEVSVTSPLSTVDNNEIQLNEKTDTNKDCNLVAQPNGEVSTTSNDMSSMVEDIERGQKTSAVLETLNPESEESWDSLEPPIHLEKIKKKKVKTVYLFPEGKSLPNIAVWDSVLEPFFLSGDFKSLGSIIEKQRIFQSQQMSF